MIRVFVVSDSYSHFKEAIETYESRLSREVEIIKIAPERSQDPKMVIKKESERIIKVLEKAKARPIYLDIAAKQYSTEALFQLVERERNDGRNVDFLVGGAFWVDQTLCAGLFSMRISLSELTFPHSLALLLLLEQIYRIGQIRKNSGYHHAS